MLPQLAMLALMRRLGPAAIEGEGALVGAANIARSLPSMAPMYFLMADQNAHQLKAQNPAMPVEQAYEIGQQASVVQTGFEYVQDMLTLGGFKAASQALKVCRQSFLKTLGTQFLYQTIEQNTLEAVQDITPQIVTALHTDAPEQNWNEVLYGKSGFWAQRADTFSALLPAIAFGAIMRTRSYRAMRPALEKAAASITDEALHAAGIQEAARAAILAETDAVERLDAFHEALPQADKATAAEGAKRLEAAQHAAARAFTAQLQEAGITLERVPGDTPLYRVTGPDNVVTEHATARDAMDTANAQLAAHRSAETGTAETPDKSWGASNKLITREAYEASRRRFREAMGRTSMGLDPEQVREALMAGLYHLEAGAQKFAEWSAAMVNQLGEDIRPHLPDLFERIRSAPVAEPFHAAMTGPEHSADSTHTPPAAPDGSMQESPPTAPAPDGPMQDRERLGPQKIDSAPPAVRVPHITIPHHSGGMVRALRAWAEKAKAGLTERLTKIAGHIITNWSKLQVVKSTENPLHHFQALAALPEIYEHSRVAYREKDRTGASEIVYERRYAWVDFPDGKRRHVMLTVRLYPDPAMPRGLYALEALGLEIHETDLTYSPAPARGAGDDIDQSAAGHHLKLFRSGIKPEHSAETGHSSAPQEGSETDAAGLSEPSQQQTPDNAFAAAREDDTLPDEERLTTRPAVNTALDDPAALREFTQRGTEALADAVSRIAGLYGAKSVRKPGSIDLSVTAASNGEIRLTIGEDYLAAKWRQARGNRSLAEDKLFTALDEEITHAATLAVLRDAWRQANSRVDFRDWMKNHSMAVLADVSNAVNALDADGQAAARKQLHAAWRAYYGVNENVTGDNILTHFSSRLAMEKIAQSPGSFVLELVRQVVQMKRYGKTSETLFQRALTALTELGGKILAQLRKLSAGTREGKFGERLKGLVQRTEDALLNGSPFTAKGTPLWGEEFYGSRPTARTDKPASWDAVRPGHAWNSSKRFLPNTGDQRVNLPQLYRRGTWAQMVNRVANWISALPPLTDPWGNKVVVAHPQKAGAFADTVENRASHLIGTKQLDAPESTRAFDSDKMDWLGAVPDTIEHAQVRVVSADGGEYLYFRRYKEGIHMVVVEKDGTVVNQYGLITQYGSHTAGSEMGALVELLAPGHAGATP